MASLASSLRLVYQNNLNASSAGSHISAFLTGPLSSDAGKTFCAKISEQPLPLAHLTAHSNDFSLQFKYLCYAGLLSCPTAVWIENGAIIVDNETVSFSLQPASKYSGQSLPQLCTQSDDGGIDANSNPTSTNQINVSDGNGNTYTGYHNKKAFRFLGIPYANQFQRFEYSSSSTATKTHFNATAYGPHCIQTGTGPASEECLFLNIHSPYLPDSSSNSSSLRPVLFYIHGGAFVSGSGSSTTLDGDNLASREDIVMVSINYRLSTYGFMAASGSSLKGNYGVSDMVSALDWVLEHIKYFGGDPSKVTIVGESAGAGGVRILLGSPKAIGKYQNAIVMSNLGGGVDLGESGNIGTTNSQYYTIEQSYDIAGKAVFTKAGCTQSTIADQVTCLKAYNGNLAELSTTSRFPVQDGTYINTPYLEVGKSGSIAHVPVMMGNMKNDGASFVKFPKSCSSEASCIAYSLEITESESKDIIDSGLFPYYDTGNLTLDSFNVSQRVRTDDTFRCIDQATAYAAVTSGSMGPVYYYQVMRAYIGYNPAGVDDVGPTSTAYPYGDPNEPYFRVHSGELGFALGTQYVFRDDDDYNYFQLMTSYWASFVRTGDPNPDQALLRVRGYTATLDAVKQTGPWSPVSGKAGPLMELDYPAHLQKSFNEVAQCNWLNYSLSYYLQ